MRQSKPEKKKSRADRDDETSFKRLGGRNLNAEDEAPDAEAQGEAEESAEEEDGGEEMPGMTERADAGLKVADHLGKAASGGTIRKVYSLWRVSKQLPVAAAGAGDLVKRNPAITALVGGVAAAAAIYLLASRAAAASSSGAEESGDEQNEADDQAEDQTEARDQAGSDEDEAGEEQEQEAAPRRAQKRSKSRG